MRDEDPEAQTSYSASFIFVPQCPAQRLAHSRQQVCPDDLALPQFPHIAFHSQGLPELTLEMVKMLPLPLRDSCRGETAWKLTSKRREVYRVREGCAWAGSVLGPVGWSVRLPENRDFRARRARWSG